MQGACGEHGDISRVETWPAEELSAPWEVVWHLWFPSTNISHSAAEAHRDAVFTAAGKGVGGLTL